MQWHDPDPVDIPGDLLQVAGSAVAAELLMRRGIVRADQARAFLDPDAYMPAPPEDLPDLALTVQRLEQAIAQGEPMAVWGDFDVDGQTSTALYVQTLRDLGGDVQFYIPTRHESHGLHAAGVQRLIDQGVRLLITADTGIDAYAAVDLAATHDVDVLITDHHDIPSTCPDALTLVNPKRLPADHPMYELPGVGVAFQVARALYERQGRSADHLLDLAALGIVADVAALRGDVRYWLQRGLAVLRRTERIGLQAMLALADLSPAMLNEQDIGFTLAPRLNALSRVGQEMDAAAGVELLITADRVRARTIAVALDALNAQRKFLVRETFEAALKQIEHDRSLLDGPVLVLAGSHWEPGVVGIVAGRLAQQFNRPAIVFSAPPGQVARGSARSMAGIDIHAAIAASTQFVTLHRYGGHPMAAGVSLDSEQIGNFRRALWRVFAESGVRLIEPPLEIDAWLELGQLSLDLVADVQRLAPFGPANEQPTFAIRHLELAGHAAIGRTEEHRRMVVRDAAGREQTVMWWQSADLSLPAGPFDLACRLGINIFRGQSSLQVIWVDARPVTRSVIAAVERPSVRITDYRQIPYPEAMLRSLLAADASLLVWGEGVSVSEVVLLDRTALQPAPHWVVWTAPPGPQEWHSARQRVHPQHIIVFALDPRLDTPAAFLERLAGLVKYAAQHQAGRADLTALAAAMAHRPDTVRLGLEWLACKGQIEVAWLDRDHLTVSLSGQAANVRNLAAIQTRLQAQLAETAAFRAFLRRADAAQWEH